MVTDALIVGDEFIDQEGYEYTVVATSPHEIVAKLASDRAPLPGENVFVVFERNRINGAWQDRDLPHPKPTIVEVI